jgi:hypothetical protein
MMHDEKTNWDDAGHRASRTGLWALLGTAMLVGCVSGMRVQRVSDGYTVTDDHRRLVYALPKSVVTVDVPITRTVTSPGRCSDKTLLEMAAPNNGVKLGEQLQRLNIKPIAEFSSEIEVGDVALGQRMEPDPTEIFAIVLEKDLLQNDKFVFELTESGMLVSGSVDSSNRIVDTAAKGLTAIANIASGAIAVMGAPAVAKVDGDQAKWLSCQESLVRLQKSRSAREALVRGDAQTAGTPKDTFDAMLTESKNVEAAYAGEFTGAKKVVKGLARCEVRAQAIKDETAIKDSYDLMTYDTLKVVNKSAAAVSCVVTPELLDVPKKDGTAIVIPPPKLASEKTIRLLLVADATFARRAAITEPKGATESGLYYRVPVRAVTTVLDGATEKTRSTLDIPQFGTVVSLPGDADVESAAMAVAAKFGPAGGLVSYSHATTAPDTATLTEASGSAGKAVLDAVKARQGAEIEELERAKKRLELKQAIEKLESGEALEESD